MLEMVHAKSWGRRFRHKTRRPGGLETQEETRGDGSTRGDQGGWRHKKRPGGLETYKETRGAGNTRGDQGGSGNTRDQGGWKHKRPGGLGDTRDQGGWETQETRGAGRHKRGPGGLGDTRDQGGWETQEGPVSRRHKTGDQGGWETQEGTRYTRQGLRYARERKVPRVTKEAGKPICRDWLQLLCLWGSINWSPLYLVTLVGVASRSPSGTTASLAPVPTGDVDDITPWSTVLVLGSTILSAFLTLTYGTDIECIRLGHFETCQEPIAMVTGNR